MAVQCNFLEVAETVMFVEMEANTTTETTISKVPKLLAMAVTIHNTPLVTTEGRTPRRARHNQPMLSATIMRLR
jgi:hypothetical protein